MSNNAINTFRLYKKRLKQYGLSKFFKRGILKYLNLDSIQEEVDSLYFYLNEITDIKSFPDSKNIELRLMQECNMVTLAIFDKLCRKHNLSYWLAYGTLLGAVRHGKKIPWDDDTDISMPRGDYNKVESVLKPELESMGFKVYKYDDEPLRRLGLGYMHEKTGIWVDIFPVDTFDVKASSFEDVKKIVTDKVNYYRLSIFDRNRNLTEEQLQKKKDICFSQFKKGNFHVYVHTVESTSLKCIISTEDMLYPLKRVPFGEYQLNIPADSKSYLEMEYGLNYMKYPRGGILHHGEASGRLPLYKWASLNGIDMNEILSHLKDVNRKLL